jgi:hypothetical protein
MAGNGPCGGAADDGWSVLMAGLGQRRKLEGGLGAGARLGVRRGSSPEWRAGSEGGELGRRLHTSTPDVEVVAGGDPDKVLRLGGGYVVVRAELIRKRRRGCGAHQGGKQRRRFGANPVRAVTLQRSRPMHGLCGEERKECRTRPQNGRERWRAAMTFDRKKKGDGEGFNVGGATRRKEEGGPVERDVEGRRMGPGVRQLRGSGGDGRWYCGVQCRVEAGERAAHVGCA